MHDEFMEALKTVLNVNRNTGVEVTFTVGTVEELVARLDRYEGGDPDERDGDLKLEAQVQVGRNLLAAMAHGDGRAPGARTVLDNLWREVIRLRGQLKRVTQDMPSWANGTPEDYDHWLRGITPVDRRLRFYQWVGRQATNELLNEVYANVDADPTPDRQRSYTGETVHEILNHAEENGPYPGELPTGRHMCDVQWHTHANGMGYLPTCRLDSED